MRAFVIVCSIVIATIFVSAGSSPVAAIALNNRAMLNTTSAIDAICKAFCPVASHEGVAGIIGNAEQESSLNPKAKQYGGGPGRGLFQESVGGLWAVNIDYCKEHGCDVWSAKGQADFVKATIFERKWADRAYGWGTAVALQRALKGKNIDQTTEAFMTQWERCGDCDTANRINYAKQHLAQVNKRC